ncbi:hypothetical protein M0R04_08725 [Candidatus Dojkabacteria bacterium]|jgi:hypothetical protein|nr:hypothetical protein [Candidatus Dojkabacteria bacterium]
MVLDPRTEFSPTQREIIKIIPIVENLIDEVGEQNIMRIKDYKRFLFDLEKEYKWLECRCRACFIEITKTTLEKYCGTNRSTNRGLKEETIVYWFTKFKNHYFILHDERLKTILDFLKFKYMQLKVHSGDITYSKDQNDPILVKSLYSKS